MTVRKDRKVVRYRGSKTHGCGSMKKRRGKGNKGGKGMSGSGKRADQKKPSIWKNKKYFGKHGFKTPKVNKLASINIIDIEQLLPKLVDSRKVTEEKGSYKLKLSELGYDKLLSRGKATKKYIIEVSYASQKAIDKIKEAGGEVLTPK